MKHFFAFVLVAVVCQSSIAHAQSRFAAEQPSIHLKVGAGIDYWSMDYAKERKFGPSAWAGAELWRGLGVQAEMHSLVGGGNLQHFKYIVGEGGPIYTFHRWRRIQPYGKAELGFASLDTTQPGELHSTHATWALGGGFEYHSWRRIWTRVDYTYDGYPQFYSTNTNQSHTLNPAGITVGFTYHLR